MWIVLWLLKDVPVNSDAESAELRRIGTWPSTWLKKVQALNGLLCRNVACFRLEHEIRLVGVP